MDVKMNKLVCMKTDYFRSIQDRYTVCVQFKNCITLVLDMVEWISEKDKSCLFRVSEANKTFAICTTYPQLLAVPTMASDDLLRSVSFLRSNDCY